MSHAGAWIREDTCWICGGEDLRKSVTLQFELETYRTQDPELAGETLTAASGYLQWYPSEFSKLTLGFERVMPARITAVDGFRNRSGRSGTSLPSSRA